MFSFKRRRFTKLFAASILALNTQLAMSEALTNVAIKTSMGEIVLELYPERAPKTVENFLRYVKAGHYSNTIFHRVIDNFMIQGGGFDKKMQEKSTGKPIALEARYALDHDLKNEPGTIAMARTNDPNSATAQFFINVNDNDFLNHQILPEGDPVEYSRRGEMIKSSRAQALNATAGYTPFGKVIKGMDVVEKIKVVRTNGNSGMMPNVPLETVTIESIKVIK
ncbi:peptidyl-prolyl cis-trans isomerase [Undibacterium parvum]|uniref:Peptidyl-prolyl cis-trans isomerase n=2 Tax=Undibacterium parvum TaxID=401471 RepID=A0A3Q9BN09_9BURK|nr:peptidyl-prolyl cis-trans isomerase [Undibacterium parvum]